LLPSLLSLLNTRNITESAKALNVTQSAMSKTLTQIREAFNDPILVREANHFVLTQRGEALKEQLPSLIQTLDNLYLPKELDITSCQRKFVLASSDYVSQFILADICAKMVEDAPEVIIEYQLWQKNWLHELSQRPVDLVSTIVDEIPENLYGKKTTEAENKIDDINIGSKISTVAIELTQNMMNYSKSNNVECRDIIPAGNISISMDIYNSYIVRSKNIISI